MKILEKFTKKHDNYYSVGVPTIAFLGDSVTHGCFEIYLKNERMMTKVDTKMGYPEKVRTIFNILYPDAPVNIISAGISGDTAGGGLKRLERDVLNFGPDLVVVCFGLNDAMYKGEGIDTYTNALDKIFEKIKSSGAEIIFMTPNLMTGKLEIPYGIESFDNVVNNVIKITEEDWLNKYMVAAKEIAKKHCVPVCDCHLIWTKLIQNGVNVNDLLSNRVNHPTGDMHWMFAYELVRTIFEN